MKKINILLLLSFFISYAIQCAEKAEEFVDFREHNKKTISMASYFQYLENWSEEDINGEHKKIIEGIKNKFNLFKDGKTISQQSKYSTITLTTFYFDDTILNGIKEILNLDSSTTTINELRFSKCVFKTQELLDNLSETFQYQNVDAKYGNTVKRN